MNQKTTVFLVIGFVGFLALLLAWNSLTFTVNSGERAVIFRKFQGGLDRDKVFKQGFHLKLPWDDVFVYDVRKKEATSTMEVLSRNGLTIKVELSYRYFPNEIEIGILHDRIGEDYLQKIVIPSIRSATREVIGKYLPEELYSSKREDIQFEITNRTAVELEKNFLTLDAVLIREVTLPENLREAIERKLQQEQASLEYEFKLQQAKKEAERQRIEAEGKAAANDIINRSLTEAVLREKGIQATVELASSPNSKTVIIGSGKDGMPLILNSGK